jgi:hypothetical protein
MKHPKHHPPPIYFVYSKVAPPYSGLQHDMSRLIIKRILRQYMTFFEAIYSNTVMIIRIAVAQVLKQVAHSTPVTL